MSSGALTPWTRQPSEVGYMTIVSGVYLIVNTTNQKVYVGSSVNIHARWRQHKRSLIRGDSPCVKLQRAWNKYGESAFSFQVLEPVSPKKELLIEAEQRWIDIYDASNKGYNTLGKAYSHLGAKRTDESKKRLSKSLKERFKDPEVKQRMRDAAKKRGVSDAFLKAKKNPISPEKLQKMRESRLVNYIVTSPNGGESLVSNIHEFCNEHGLHWGSFHCVLHRQYRHYRGWRIRWEDEPSRDDGNPYVISKSYTCIAPNGQSYSTDNLKEFCAVHGLARNAMASVASPTSRLKSHRGWKCIKHEVLALSDFTNR